MDFSSGYPDEDNASEVNLTSLIDVIFNLVLFLMVTTTFSGRDAISIDLPIAHGKELAQEKKDVTVSITEDEKLFVDELEITQNQLLERLEQLSKSVSIQTLVIRADKKVPHGKVVAVMDAAKKSGVEKIAIATIKP